MSSPDVHHKKKRAGKACDLCRIKKTKCDGRKPCLRCVADNRICTFTEKRKNKEKVHPPGYFELLETRVELLTRSLEKMIHLLEPHLPWLQQLMAKLRADHPPLLPALNSLNPPSDDYVPINEVVAHLIAQHGLLDNLPVDFDHAALEMGRPLAEDDYLTALDTENPQALGHKRLAPLSRLALDRLAVSRLSLRRGLRQGVSSGSSGLAAQSMNSNLNSTINSTNSQSSQGFLSGQVTSQGQITPGLTSGQITPGLSQTGLGGLALDPDVRPSAQFFASYALAVPGALSLSLLLTSLTARFENHDLDPLLPDMLFSDALALPPALSALTTFFSHSQGFSHPLGQLHLQLHQQPQGLRRHASHKDALRRQSDHVHKPKAHSHLLALALARYRQDLALPASPGSLGYDAFSPAQSALEDFAAFPLDDGELEDDWRTFTTIRAE